MKRSTWIPALAATTLLASVFTFAVVQLTDAPPGLSGVTASTEQKGTVLLVPGHGGDASMLNPLARRLLDDGYKVEVVPIGDGSGDIQKYAKRVVAAAKDIDGPLSLVGYSQGGLIARAAAQLAPDRFGRVVTIATPHEGTDLAAAAAALKVACDLSCRQMVPGSPFLASLTLPVRADRWLALYSNGDQVVQPAAAGALPGATNIAMDKACRETFDHYEIVAAPESAEAVSKFLATGHRPETC